MQKQNFILSLFFIVALAACKRRETVVLSTDILTYNSTVSVFNNSIHVTEAKLQANLDGKLFLQLNLRNESEDLFIASSTELELETPDGLRSNPLAMDSVLEINPKESLERQFVFKPINSLKFFQMTGLEGDFCQRYTLRVKNGLFVAKFNLPDHQFKSYQAARGIEKRLMVFSMNADSSFVGEELNYLNRAIQFDEDHDFRTTHEVRANDQEILIDGLNMRLLAYQLDDTLVVKMNLVNHSPFAVRINPAQSKIVSGEKKLLPLNGADEIISIIKSQRHQFILKFAHRENNASDIALEMNTLCFSNRQLVPVCSGLIPLKKMIK